MNSKHHYTKFVNVSQLQGAQCFHLDGLTLQAETLLGLLDSQDEGSALQNSSNYLSVNSVYHFRDYNSHQHCCIPSKMVEVRYAGVDRAAGYRGMLVQARAGHLRNDIQDSNRNSLGVEYAGLV
jgi:hypothetical protein